MSFAESREDDVVVVAPAGRLDSNNYKALEARLLEIVAQGDKRLVLDLGGLDYCSSAGLRVLLLIAKRMKAGQGKVALAALQPAIREVLDVSGFAAIFTIAPDRANAIAAVK